MKVETVIARVRMLATEPIAVFFVVAAGVMWVGVSTEPEPAGSITIDEATVAATRTRLAATLKRPPADGELEQALESLVDDEVLYREAIRLGLDRRDPIVRRRLIQKMEMVLEGTAEVDADSEEALMAWYDTNQDEFTRPSRRSFSQMQLGEVSEDELRLLESRANELGLESDDGGARAMGAPSAHARAQRGMSRAETAARFGEGVARVVFSTEEHQWRAVRGAHGWMLVRVDQVFPAGPAAFSQVRGQVRELRAAEARAQARSEALKRLRSSYDLEVQR